MDGGIIVYALIILVLVVCSAFFSLTETAFTGASRIKLKTLANDGDRRAEKALGMLEDYDRFLTTNLIGVNVVNIASSTVATVMFVALFGDLGSLVNIVVMTLVSLTFCEIIPKSVARKAPERWCMRTCNIFSVLLRALSPVSWLFTRLTRAIGKEESSVMSDEELEVLIDETEAGGALKESESDLIKSAIRFDDARAGDLCVPRTGVTALPEDASPEEVGDVLAGSGFSRVPVYRGTLDDIVGVVYAKEYLAREHSGMSRGIEDLMRPVKFVPESMTASDLLSGFQRDKAHMAVVLDSYGGTVGIVTIEDVLEALVGEIWDESDEVPVDIVVSEDGSVSARGTSDVYAVMDALGRDFGLDGYDERSLNGFLMSRLNRTPVVGDEVEADGVVITVVSVDGHRADECRVTDLHPKG